MTDEPIEHLPFEFEDPEPLMYEDDVIDLGLEEQDLIEVPDLDEGTPLDVARMDLFLAKERGKRGIPPNLRESDTDKRCGNCVHYRSGDCELYNYSVKPGQVCDSFRANENI